MGLKDWLFGKRSHDGVSFKAGTRAAIILEALCGGQRLSGWDVCKLLKTHNGDRDLRRVRARLRAIGIFVVTSYAIAANGRTYKVTSIMPGYYSAARKLIKGGK